MQIFNTQKIPLLEIYQLIKQQRSKSSDVSGVVQAILADVKQNGDQAVLKYTYQFDGSALTNLAVSNEEIKQAYKLVDSELIDALKLAKANIEAFHQHILKTKESPIEVVSGVSVWREFRPIEKVGLYVPGGKAAYPSTVLMLAVPAKIAQCSEIVICTPADKNGQCNPAVLVTADLCGIKQIFKVGGAQAIGAMAYGTNTIPKVYKIFGPGNQFVTTAKMMVYGEVDIDMPAGPSELAIIADETANPVFIAADFLSQLEHGVDSQSVLFTCSSQLIDQVLNEINRQLSQLSRQEIIKLALEKSVIILCQNNEEIINLVNEYAPEHLEIMTKSDDEIMSKINNAGSIFLGAYTSEPLGDYVTGANHTLPTSGFAKMFSPLSTDSFGKMVQIQKVSPTGIKLLYPTLAKIADSEGLDAHKNAVYQRYYNL